MINFKKIFGKPREIDFLKLVSRIGENNYFNLSCFSNILKQGLKEKKGIDSSCYLIGIATLPDKELKSVSNIDKLDLIVAAHNKSPLIPDKSNPLFCELAYAIIDLYNDERLFDGKLAETKTKELKLSSTKIILEDTEKSDYVRPNGLIEFENQLPIHIIVQYFNPTHYKKNMDGGDQYTYRRSLWSERLNNNSFCLL